MRKILLIGTALVFPMSAVAQTTPSLAESVPVPHLETEIDGYRLAAISVSAVAGIIVANYLTGGLITPVLLAGAGDAGMVAATSAAVPAATAAAVPAATSAAVPAATSLAETVAIPAVATAAVALIGGYIGNWVYGD